VERHGHDTPLRAHPALHNLHKREPERSRHSTTAATEAKKVRSHISRAGTEKQFLITVARGPVIARITNARPLKSFPSQTDETCAIVCGPDVLCVGEVCMHGSFSLSSACPSVYSRSQYG
jgi:hypothetical protein